MARKDPALAFCFRVTITKSSLGVNLDKASGLFKSVSGLGVETEVVDFKEGGVNDMTHKLVGGAKYKNIVLKRGVVGPELMDWRANWESGLASGKGKSALRTNGFIEQLDTKGNTIAKWEFTDGWPCKWEMSEFDAGKNEVSMETLEIAHSGVKRA